jgi:hypothetical protein
MAGYFHHAIRQDVIVFLPSSPDVGKKTCFL